jgi:excisionase family DNA binding protein
VCQHEVHDHELADDRFPFNAPTIAIVLFTDRCVERPRIQVEDVPVTSERQWAATTTDQRAIRALESTSDDGLLTVQDTARFLKVPVSWVYEHVRLETDDRLPAVKLGKYLRFHRRDLEAYIDAKRDDSRRQPRRR